MYIEGAELYRILAYNSDIDILKYYFVVFWNNNEVSIIKIKSLYAGGKILLDMEAVDQNNIQWKLLNPNLCF